VRKPQKKRCEQEKFHGCRRFCTHGVTKIK
jgi:hypothetical protein